MVHKFLVEEITNQNDLYSTNETNKISETIEGSIENIKTNTRFYTIANKMNGCKKGTQKSDIPAKSMIRSEILTVSNVSGNLNTHFFYKATSL